MQPMPQPQSKQIRGHVLSAEQVLETFANIINYLNVSLYEGQFTHKHEQARARINALYDEVTNKSNTNEPGNENATTPPFANECAELYSNLMCLWNVTDTDDPDYHNYIRKIKYLIIS